MGGFGSGLWERADSRKTVEECLRLDIWDFLRGNHVCPGTAGTVSWWNTASGQLKASVAYCFRRRLLGELDVDLSFCLRDSDAIVQRVPIVLNRSSDGRTATWFSCPLVRSGSQCGRHVRKLYANGPFFGCRHCHKLTYESCQKAHKDERLLRRIGRFDVSTLRRIGLTEEAEDFPTT